MSTQSETITDRHCITSGFRSHVQPPQDGSVGNGIVRAAVSRSGKLLVRSPGDDRDRPVGSAIQSRLITEGKAGRLREGGSSYSVWYNGGLRTTTDFHNMIGILTETIGNPTRWKSVRAERQLPAKSCDSRLLLRNGTSANRSNTRSRRTTRPRSRLVDQRSTLMKHVPDGEELDREGQPGYLDHYAVEDGQGRRAVAKDRCAEGASGGAGGARGGRAGALGAALKRTSFAQPGRTPTCSAAGSAESIRSIG